MADGEPVASNGIRTGHRAESTDAALEAGGNDPPAHRKQGARRYSGPPKLGTGKILWVLVLTLPVTIGVLVIAIGFFGVILRVL